MNWTPALSLANARLDEQHQAIFAAAEALTTCKPEALATQLAALLACVHQHLRAEELLMQAAGYPGFATHRALHVAFEHQLAGIVERLAAEPAILVLRDLRAHVTRWLYQHIMHVDQLIKPYLATLSVVPKI